MTIVFAPWFRMSRGGRLVDCSTQTAAARAAWRVPTKAGAGGAVGRYASDRPSATAKAIVCLRLPPVPAIKGDARLQLAAV